MFRANLEEIGAASEAYGTHSFRRGGCQWLATDLHKSLTEICQWGGWSLELSPNVIMRYLYSPNDDPASPREDFLNLHLQRHSEPQSGFFISYPVLYTSNMSMNTYLPNDSQHFTW